MQRPVGWINEFKSPLLLSLGSGKEGKTETNWKMVSVYNYYIQVLDLNFKNFWKGKEIQEAAIAPAHKGNNHNLRDINLEEDWETARKPETNSDE